MRPVLEYTKVLATSSVRERQDRLKFDGDGRRKKDLAGQMVIWARRADAAGWTPHHEAHGRGQAHLRLPSLSQCAAPTSLKTPRALDPVASGVT
jgi:hypothetical protein